MLLLLLQTRPEAVGLRAHVAQVLLDIQFPAHRSYNHPRMVLIESGHGHHQRPLCYVLLCAVLLVPLYLLGLQRQCNISATCQLEFLLFKLGQVEKVRSEQTVLAQRQPVGNPHGRLQLRCIQDRLRNRQLKC
jgi:hypothetical protein